MQMILGQQQNIGKEIAQEGYRDETGHLTNAGYELVTDAVPIMCVDVIPVEISNSGLIRMGTIVRATGSEKGKLAILGGRIQKNERVSTAIARHLSGSFGSSEFDYHFGNDEDTPFYLAQYKHADSDSEGYDPTKHAIAPTYLIDIEEPEQVKDEALTFTWITPDQIPETSAYNHHIALQRAADFLRQIYG